VIAAVQSMEIDGKPSSWHACALKPWSQIVDMSPPSLFYDTIPSAHEIRKVHGTLCCITRLLLPDTLTLSCYGQRVPHSAYF
jgi:hypothetical protein